MALCVSLVAGGAGSLVSRARADDLAPGPGADIVAHACAMCHQLDHVVQIHKSRSDWQSTVDLMATYGMQMSDEDKQKVVDYLSANYGFESPKSAAPAGAGAPDSPDQHGG